MNGAEEYYDIVQKAYRLKVLGLEKLNLEYGWGGGDSEAFIHDHFVFVTSTHARGKCFKIFLIDEYEDEDDIKRNSLEVYGVTSGQPGWTEEYGWVLTGKWVTPIEIYLNKLSDKIKEMETTKLEKMRTFDEQKKKEFDNKVKRYNSLF